MKKNLCAFCILIVSLLAFGGAACHKREAASDKPKTLEEGVTELRAALVSASPEVQSNFYNGVSFGIRYGDYAKASQALQRIASDPGLNEQQKLAVNEVSNLLQQAIASKQNAH